MYIPEENGENGNRGKSKNKVSETKDETSENGNRN